MYEFVRDYSEVMSDWKLWIDDRDFDLNYNWESDLTGWAGEEAKRLSFKLEVAWLKIRYTLVSAVCFSVCKIFNPSKPVDSSINLKIRHDFDVAVEEAESLMQVVNKCEMYKKLQLSIFSPFTPPMANLFKLELHKFYRQLLDRFTSVIGFGSLSKFVNDFNPGSFYMDNTHLALGDLLELHLVCEALSLSCIYLKLVKVKTAKEVASSKKGNKVIPKLEKEFGQSQLKNLLSTLLEKLEASRRNISEKASTEDCEVDVELVAKNADSILLQFIELCKKQIERLDLL